MGKVISTVRTCSTVEKELVEIKTQLARLDEKVANIHDNTAEMRTELLILIKTISCLKVKASIFGIIGGAIPACVALIIFTINFLK